MLLLTPVARVTPVDQRYSQTEREALAVVWGCEYYHIYIYGKPVTVNTDHKPLIAIYNNLQSKPPARIERWTLRLQPYQVTAVTRTVKITLLIICKGIRKNLQNPTAERKELRRSL